MNCFAPKCREPRTHNLAWCAVHYGLADKQTRGRYEYALSMVQRCREVSGPKLDRCILRLKEAREDVTQAIKDAIAAHQELP